MTNTTIACNKRDAVVYQPVAVVVEPVAQLLGARMPRRPAWRVVVAVATTRGQPGLFATAVKTIGRQRIIPTLAARRSLAGATVRQRRAELADRAGTRAR